MRKFAANTRSVGCHVRPSDRPPSSTATANARSVNVNDFWIIPSPPSPLQWIFKTPIAPPPPPVVKLVIEQPLPAPAFQKLVFEQLLPPPVVKLVLEQLLPAPALQKFALQQLLAPTFAHPCFERTLLALALEIPFIHRDFESLLQLFLAPFGCAPVAPQISNNQSAAPERRCNQEECYQKVKGLGGFRQFSYLFSLRREFPGDGLHLPGLECGRLHGCAVALP